MEEKKYPEKQKKGDDMITDDRWVWPDYNEVVLGRDGSAQSSDLDQIGI